ncbi:hypothetical protein NKH85_15745 [Mesorhizobium sp. M0924]|uniref:hypothetical protein n=1 Tax=unclassified Mesorhizobium TaxID=325217 RepID=UPI00333D2F5E
MRNTRLAILGGLALFAMSGQAHALTMAECTTKFNAAKDAGTLTQTWNVFQKSECGPNSKPVANQVSQTAIEKALQIVKIVIVGERICDDFTQDQIAYIHNSAVANLSSATGRSIYEVRAKLGGLESQLQSQVDELTGDSKWKVQEKICPLMGSMLGPT